jgi:hypothetical protein
MNKINRQLIILNIELSRMIRRLKKLDRTPERLEHYTLINEMIDFYRWKKGIKEFEDKLKQEEEK